MMMLYNDPHVPEGQCMLWGEKTLNEERKKTESHSAIEQKLKKISVIIWCVQMERDWV